MPEQFSSKEQATDQKLRGGYYTPDILSEYLANWAIRTGCERILEPSRGDGSFIRSAARRLCHVTQDSGTIGGSLTGVELQHSELTKAANALSAYPQLATKTEWISADFFEAYGSLKAGPKFDVVLGNPPFIRFQYFEEESRKLAFGHLKKAGYRPTKLANAWAAFVQLSIELVAENGRLAMVVPAEILQVAYAGELRERLTKKFRHIVLIGFKKLVFPDIQQEVLLLLAEGKHSGNITESNIHTIEFLDGNELIESGELNTSTAHIPAKHSRNGMKWTSLFLSEESFQALDEAESLPGIIPLGDLADVAVGVITGRNQFFVLTKAMRDEMNAGNYTIPVVGRTAALKSNTFTIDDFDAYREDNPSYLLDLSNHDIYGLPAILKNYLKIGEKNGVHQGYKCRIRKRWFDVPSIYIPDAFLFRQIHRYPLLVVNKAKAVSTDTIHRVRFNNGVNGDLLAAVAFNSLTLAWAEVCGRSYGGGVLELEPNEAKQLPIPYDNNIQLDIQKVDRLLRSGKYENALDYVDQTVLIEHFGFDKRIVRGVRNAWIELRDRRINRKPQ